jgi:(p)ppGpp synthase/HD superfamily hydrolase
MSRFADRYTQALLFAATAHAGQKFPGSELPYLVHVVNVAAELTAARLVEVFDEELACVCALLHDTIEDTPATAESIEAAFGAAVAAGVLALSKNPALPKGEQMADSLGRIQQQPAEIARVKLADRIVNLAHPPSYWSVDKCKAYHAEAMLILDALGGSSPVLAVRLREKIAAYAQYTVPR